MKATTKKRLHIAVALLIAIASFILLLSGLRHYFQPLKSYPKSVGTISNKGTEIVQNPKSSELQEVFFLQLDTPEIAMSFFKYTQDYTFLLNQLWKGDSVTVYYTSLLKGREHFEAKLVQVEKKGRVVISHFEYQKKDRIIAIMGGGGLTFSGVMLHQVLRWGKRRKKKTSS